MIGGKDKCKTCLDILMVRPSPRMYCISYCLSSRCAFVSWIINYVKFNKCTWSKQSKIWLNLITCAAFVWEDSNDINLNLGIEFINRKFSIPYAIMTTYYRIMLFREWILKLICRNIYFPRVEGNKYIEDVVK